MNKKYNTLFRVVAVLLIVIAAFKTVDFALSEIADINAYKDVINADSKVWAEVYKKIENHERLTEKDYSLIFCQTGLGMPAVDFLIENPEKINEYRDYYLEDKDFKCLREGVFACHEAITDSKGNLIQNPAFANLENGDIIITLSIHSLGWRHGHAAIVTDAENGVTMQAVMIGEKSAKGHIGEWRDLPTVAVLRAKDLSADTRNEIARFAEEKLTGIEYSLASGILNGRDINEIPAVTHCSHCVWYAYYCFGVDIDSNGGRIVTPKEILNSDKLEIVQIYGNITDL